MKPKRPKAPVARLGPWKKMAQRVIPDALSATWGGSFSPTILYLEEEVTEQRRLPDGSFEIRSRRVPVLTLDARELGPEYQAMAVCVHALQQQLQRKMQELQNKRGAHEERAAR